VAVDAERSAALGDRLPAGAALAGRRMLRGPGGGFARCVAACRGARRAADRRSHRQPHAALDPESGARAGYDGAKRKKGSKLHLAVDTLGHWLALHVTPADADDRAEVGRIAKAVQAATQSNVEIAFVDQGYTGETPRAAAAEHGVELCVVKLPEAKRGFILLPRRWVVERSFAWTTRFRRLVKDYERCAATLADLHLIAFVCIMLKNVAKLAVGP